MNSSRRSAGDTTEAAAASTRRTSAAPPPTDHRTRVGAVRRERTREKIVASALHVFAQRGPDAPVIDDFIAAAGIARGTFYNYFKSTPELLEAACKWLEDDLIVSIESEISGLDNPAHRVAMGVRLWIHRAQSDAQWCAFAARAWRHGSMVEQKVDRDLRAGRHLGLFDFPNIEAARDLLIGTCREAMVRLCSKRARRGFADDVARVVLQGLGLERSAIDAALALPPPAMRRKPAALG